MTSDDLDLWGMDQFDCTSGYVHYTKWLVRMTTHWEKGILPTLLQSSTYLFWYCFVYRHSLDCPIGSLVLFTVQNGCQNGPTLEERDSAYHFATKHMSVLMLFVKLALLAEHRLSTIASWIWSLVSACGRVMITKTEWLYLGLWCISRFPLPMQDYSFLLKSMSHSLCQHNLYACTQQPRKALDWWALFL